VLVRSTLKPRKQPIQARSADTVSAILDATLQVLTNVGKEQLTTTRVASRAGVSVGTLYQYFPNKVALLQACLRRHMDQVVESMRGACDERKGSDAMEMADGLIEAYLSAKMHHMPSSAALYSVSSDVDGIQIAKDAYDRVRHNVAGMFATAPQLGKNPETVATVILAAMNGIARRLLESDHPAADMPELRKELLFMVHAYLRACSNSG
jgi:AcrR family transcriptional regulator